MLGGAAPAKGVAVVGLLAGALSACTHPSNVDLYVTPAPSPVQVTITTIPAVRDDGTVPRNARFVVQLDGYPDPDSVGFGPITLRSGRANFDIRTDIDLVGRSVLVTPRSLLIPGAQYDVLVSGLATLDDRVQSEDAIGSFRAGLDEGDPVPPRPRPTWTADVRPVLATCAPFCHSPVGASGRTRTPTRLLDLTLLDPTDRQLGLVNVLSIGLRGTDAVLARVAPRDPARSVLLRKLLGGSPTADSLDPPYPNTRVDGRRMPIPLDESQPATETLSDPDLVMIQDWIFAGAPTD
ncbi:MAG: hypothetical protein JWN44_6208 [Myxococcales bacterium]|nr:hypothetical protein [Myxococcales bacterium]